MGGVKNRICGALFLLKGCAACLMHEHPALSYLLLCVPSCDILLPTVLGHLLGLLGDNLLLLCPVPLQMTPKYSVSKCAK